MDALSDLLRVVRFSGGLFLEAKFHGPWCVRSKVEPEDLGPGVRAREGLVAFHYVLEGHVQVRLGQDAARQAGPGHFVLLAHND
ncbi:MAG TPA: cupin domain-containing protein, partial [Methylomirabilota bacterium]|nr:cupin domain-containing protein [Methylomirabilota bacterium]